MGRIFGSIVIVAVLGSGLAGCGSAPGPAPTGPAPAQETPEAAEAVVAAPAPVPTPSTAPTPGNVPGPVPAPPESPVVAAWELETRSAFDQIVAGGDPGFVAQVCADRPTVEGLVVMIEPGLGGVYDLDQPLADFLGTSDEIAATIPAGTTLRDALPVFAGAVLAQC